MRNGRGPGANLILWISLKEGYSPRLKKIRERRTKNERRGSEREIKFDSEYLNSHNLIGVTDLATSIKAISVVTRASLGSSSPDRLWQYIAQFVLNKRLFITDEPC